ncbi:MAG: hypothetical protein MZU84_02625 [Sphingobacterium sp.]|nr:hypothetical protein [Sphingobacterium sp.]
MILLINGLPLVQIELKTLGINPRRAMEQIVDYQQRPRQRLRQHAALFHAALHRQQPRQHLLLRQQQQPATSPSMPTSVSCPSTSAADVKTTARSPIWTSFAEQFLAKCTLGQMISRYMVLVASEQKLLIMRPYQIYAVKAIVDCIHERLRQRLHLAHHRQRQDAHLLQGLHPAQGQPGHRQVPVRGGPQGPRPPDSRANSTSFQEGCVEENTNTDDPGAPPALGRLRRQGHRHHHPEARPGAGREQQAQQAAHGKGKRNLQGAARPAARQAYRHHLRRVPPLASSATITRPSRRSSPRRSCSASPVRPSSRRTPATRRSTDTSGSLQDHRGHLPETAARLHHHPRHRGPQRAALPHRLLQARGQADKPAPPNPGEGRCAKQQPISRRRDPRQARCRHRPAAASTPYWRPRPSTTPSTTTTCSSTVQAERQAADPDFQPLNIACVFSPPAEGNKDVQQIQEDLPQEKADNRAGARAEESRSAAAIIADYNAQYGTNHNIERVRPLLSGCAAAHQGSEVPQQRLSRSKDKIDITIVVDMLLTGFDSKYLNTLYVDKNLKHHGLIQAFSRTNRVLNDTKPYGNILDFRQQQEAVDERHRAVLRRGRQPARVKSGWSTRPRWSSRSSTPPCSNWKTFMETHGLACDAGGGQQPQGRCGARRVHQPLQGGPAPQDPARPIHRPERDAARTDRTAPAGRDAARLQGRVPGDRPAPQGAAGQRRG